MYNCKKFDCQKSASVLRKYQLHFCLGLKCIQGFCLKIKYVRKFIQRTGIQFQFCFLDFLFLSSYLDLRAAPHGHGFECLPDNPGGPPFPPGLGQGAPQTCVHQGHPPSQDLDITDPQARLEDPMGPLSTFIQSSTMCLSNIQAKLQNWSKALQIGPQAPQALHTAK